MGLLSPRHLTRAEERQVVLAIQAAEQGSRGEVRVHLEPRYGGDGPLARAQALFHELGMDQTRDGTGVLLYVAFEDHKVAVWAGPGLYGAAEPDFWREATDKVAQGFKQNRRAQGLVEALSVIGQLMRQAAPGQDSAGDELPNRVSMS